MSRRKLRRSIPKPRQRALSAADGHGAASSTVASARVMAALTIAPSEPAPVPDAVTLDRLADLVGEQRRVAAAIDIEIDRLVEAGASWPSIARVLGVSRQAARQRHQRRLQAAIEAAFGKRANSGARPASVSTTM